MVATAEREAPAVSGTKLKTTISTASESIPVPFHGEPFEIGFNPEFLRDGLESIESDELVLKLISPLRPGLVESPDTGDFVYLIMPIRLNV